MIKMLAKQHKVASVTELMEMAIDVGVRLHPCQMTMDLYGLSTSDFIDGLQPLWARLVLSIWPPRPTSSCLFDITSEPAPQQRWKCKARHYLSLSSDPHLRCTWYGAVP